MAELWLARWLGDGDRLGELRQRTASGSYPALHELAEWLARYEDLQELRELVAAHRELLSGWLVRWPPEFTGQAALGPGRPHRCWRSLRMRARSRRWAASTPGWRA